MKRVKIMLSAITVLAAVGGALAFKAKTFDAQYCVTTTTAGGGRCVISKVGQPTVGAATFYYYTTTTNVANCNVNEKGCRQISTKITIEP